uniref:TlpA family protein disulfide reductase n=1 Tax=candidate division WOR-3 bacterium TaxID=2052148 RepID=A0A7V4E4M2_UNCW3
MIKMLILLTLALLDAKEIKTLNRGIIDMDTIWGRRPVYVSFWAIWCSNCVKELDEINKIKDSLNIVVLAINEDGQRKLSRVNAFIKTKKWDFPVVMDFDQSLMKSYGVSALPTSFLYSKEKKLLRRFTGFSTKDKELLKKLLEED